jgi:outer membrane protein
MNTKMKLALSAGMALSMGLANTAMAFEPGDWLLRAGGSYVNPASDNSDIVSVESASSFTFNVGYMMTDVWGLELLAAYPFKHDIELLDGTKVGSTKQLPPTLSLQYHFMPTEAFQPYVGFGLNYTNFFSEETTGPLEGTDLDLGDSWGLAGQIGFDYLMNDNWFFNLDARYISIETKAELDGAPLPGGKVKINPWVYGVNIGFRF